MSRRGNWLAQICTIENKGYRAFVAGTPVKDCPYKGGYINHNGAGGSVQRQRRAAWCRGWQLARKAAEETKCT